MSRKLAPATLFLALLLTTPSHGQTPKSAIDAGHDFVFLAEARPLLVRVHVRVDGKPLSQANDAFFAHLFRHLDAKKRGYLDAADLERAPALGQIKTGGFDSLFSVGMGGRPGEKLVPAPKVKKLTPQDLAAHFRAQGLLPFDYQAPSEPKNDGMMMMVGGASTEPSVEAVSRAIFDTLDVQQTGKLTRADLAAAAERLLALDTNEDDLITVRELVPPAPVNPEAMRIKGPKKAFLSPDFVASPATDVFVLASPGDIPPNLAPAMQRRYGAKNDRNDDKLKRKELGLDEATFNALDANKDGFLGSAELRAFVQRAPDVEFILHLGDRKGVEAVASREKPGILAKALRTFDGLALLDLGATRVEFRGDEDASEDRLGPIMRLQWMVLFKQADKNSDGYVDANEANNSSFGGSFKAMDRDGDARVSEQEFMAYLDFIADLHVRAKKAHVALVLMDESRGLFDLLDANRDGRLSVREMRAAPELLAKLGRLGKGFLTPADLPRSYRLSIRSGPARTETDDYAALVSRIYGGGGADPAYREPTLGPLWFRKMDTNRDGDVSRREWLASDALFRQIDTDGDGLISPAEADRFDAKSRMK